MDEQRLDDGADVRDQFSAQQLDEVQGDQLAVNGGLGVEQLPDGSTVLHCNPNGSDEQALFVADANRNGGRMSRERYLALVHQVAQAYSAEYDGSNAEVLMGRALNEVWFRGAQGMWGPDAKESDAKDALKDEIRYVFDRTFITDGDKATLSEIDGAIERRVAASGLGAHGRLLRRYAKGKTGQVEISAAALKDASLRADLYNVFAGVRYDTSGRRLPDAEAMGRLWWAETHPGEEVPETVPWTDANAQAFSRWYYPRVQQEAEDYQKAFSICAREEILRRLARARSENRELDYNQELAIVDAVLYGRDGGGDGSWDDPHRFKSYLTADDIAQARVLRRREIASRREGRLLDGALAEVRREIAGEREGLAAAAEAQARAAAEKKAKQEAESARKKEEERKVKQEAEARARRIASGESDRVQAGWAYDGRDDDAEPSGCRISRERLKALTQELDIREGDVLVAHVKVGGRYVQLPVLNTYRPKDGKDKGVFLNARALLDVNGGSRRRVQYTEAASTDMKFSVIRAEKSDN